MLRTIPKHKGTERLQADIKARIKDLSEEFEGGGRSKGSSHGGPALVIRPEGAAQLALIGPPNSGKSSLHARLTHSNAHVAPYPFTTQHPAAGMMPHEDVRFQLIDLPAVSPEHPVPWLAGALQTADAALLVLDLNDPDSLDQLEGVEAGLAQKHVKLTERWDAADDTPAGADDPFGIRLPTLMLANKADDEASHESEFEAFRELTGARYPLLAVSARTGRGLDALGAWLFERLRIVRVYTKAPGHAADKGRPFTLRKGQTVGDVARLVHRDLQHSMRYARVWGRSGFAGQQVGPEHALDDGDVVELHA
jgi:ribosome-interacting GTPase 1